MLTHNQWENSITGFTIKNISCNFIENSYSYYYLLSAGKNVYRWKSIPLLMNRSYPMIHRETINCCSKLVERTRALTINR